MKIKLTETGYSLIPKGVTIFKVVEVDDSKYEKFGKITVKLQTKEGKTLLKTFALTKIVKGKAEINYGMMKAWSYFAKTCLNDFSTEEIDTQDIVGCYIKVPVEHETYTRTKGDHAGEDTTVENIKLFEAEHVDGFSGAEETEESETDDLDDFLSE